MAIEAPDGYNEITTVLDDTIQEVHVSGSAENNKITMANMKKYMKGETKALWTGPLSVVGVPTSLDVGEAFSDWDLIMIEVSLQSDSEIFTPTSMIIRISDNQCDFYSDLGRIKYQKVSDTTFQMQVKTVTAGNIQRIIGIKL